MAVVDMRYVQFWEPPSAIPSHKQRQAIPPQWKSNSSPATSARSQPTPPHTKADQILQNIEQSRSVTTAITPQQQDFEAQHRDEAEGGQGIACCSLDTIYDDDDASDYFPTIEEILRSVSRKEIRSEGHHDPEDIHAYLDKPSFGQSTSRPGLAQSRLDYTTNGCEGSRDRPVVLEDDDPDSTDAEDETASTPGDLNAVDVTQDSILNSTLPGRDDSEGRILAPSSRDARIDFDGDHTLKDEQGLYAELRRMVPAYALSQPSYPICASEPPASPASLRTYSANLRSRSEDVQHGSLFDGLQETGEHLQKEQQGLRTRDKVGDGYKEVDAEDVQSGEDELPSEPQVAEGDEPRTIPNTATEVSNVIGDCNDTSDEDDEGPRPAKRRRTLPASGLFTPRPAYLLSPRLSLAHTEGRHSSLASADDGYSRSAHTSNSSSPPVVTEQIQGAGAEYHEWGLQHASLKRTTVEGNTVFTLEFSLQDLHDLLALQSSSRVQLNPRQAKRSTRAAHSPRPTAQIKKGRPVERKRGKGHEFTPGEDAKLIGLKENQGLPWKDIVRHFPERSSGSLQVHYCTKLKNRRVSDEDDSNSEV